jgi:hypothetical protein
MWGFMRNWEFEARCEIACVPSGPVGVVAICGEEGLMMGATGLQEELFELGDQLVAIHCKSPET